MIALTEYMLSALLLVGPRSSRQSDITMASATACMQTTMVVSMKVWPVMERSPSGAFHSVT